MWVISVTFFGSRLWWGRKPCVVSPVSHTSVTLRHMRLSVVIPRIIILVNISIAIIAGDDLMEEESLDNDLCLSHFGIPCNPMCSIQHLAMHCIGYSLNLAISSTTVYAGLESCSAASSTGSVQRAVWSIEFKARNCRRLNVRSRTCHPPRKEFL